MSLPHLQFWSFCWWLLCVACTRTNEAGDGRQVASVPSGTEAGCNCRAPDGARTALGRIWPGRTVAPWPFTRTQRAWRRLHTPVVAADLLPLLLEPQRLLEMVDPHVGLAVVRLLGCERDDEVKVVKHVCAAQLEPTLRSSLTDVQNHLRNALTYGAKPGIHCTHATNTVCTLGPQTECEPEYTLYFENDTLVGFVALDDWQSPHEFRASNQKLVRTLLAESHSCPQ